MPFRQRSSDILTSSGCGRLTKEYVEEEEEEEEEKRTSRDQQLLWQNDKKKKKLFRMKRK